MRAGLAPRLSNFGDGRYRAFRDSAFRVRVQTA